MLAEAHKWHRLRAVETLVGARLERALAEHR
jgi:hypothetical protein